MMNTLQLDQEQDPADRERKTRIMGGNVAYAKKRLAALAGIAARIRANRSSHTNNIALDRFKGY